MSYLIEQKLKHYKKKEKELAKRSGIGI